MKNDNFHIHPASVCPTMHPSIHSSIHPSIHLQWFLSPCPSLHLYLFICFPLLIPSPFGLPLPSILFLPFFFLHLTHPFLNVFKGSIRNERRQSSPSTVTAVESRHTELLHYKTLERDGTRRGRQSMCTRVIALLKIISIVYGRFLSKLYTLKCRKYIQGRKAVVQFMVFPVATL